jgi:adenine/guanine/hypoxanthine permease
MGTGDGPPFTPALLDRFAQSDTWIHGAFALEQGFIFTSMVLAGTTVAIIERRFTTAAIWCALAAMLSLTGIMHGYRFTPGDTAISLQPAWEWAVGYGAMAVTLWAARWFTEPDDDGAHGA